VVLDQLENRKIKKEIKTNYNMNNIIICPNCNEFIIIEEINCGIFRDGVIKQTGIQMDPHLSKIICEELKDKNLIYGCGKPFKIIMDMNKCIKICECDYI